MHEVLLALLICVVAAPLVAVVWTVAAGNSIRVSRRYLPIVVAATLSTFASLLLLAAAMNGNWLVGGRLELHLFDWCSVPAGIPLTVPISLRFDALTGCFLLASTLTFTLAVLHAACASSACRASPHDERTTAQSGRRSDGLKIQPPTVEVADVRFLATASGLLFASLMVYCATNFVQLFLFWQLAVVVTSLLTGDKSDIRAFLAQRCSDFGLIVALIMIWSTFRTLDCDVVLSQAAIAEVVGRHGAVSVVGICVCLFVGTLGRCGLFPLSVGFSAVNQSRPAALSLRHATMMPAGIYLMLRAAPLLLAAPEFQMLMTHIVMLSVLLTAFVSVGQADVRHLVSFVSATQFGLMLLAIASGSASGIEATLLLFVSQTFSIALLFAGTEETVCRAMPAGDTQTVSDLSPVSRSARTTMLVAALVLISGGWGHNAVLNAVGSERAAGANGVSESLSETWEAEAPAESHLFAARGSVGASPTSNPAVRTASALSWWLIVGSHFLTSFAVVRAIGLGRHRAECESVEAAGLPDVFEFARILPGRTAESAAGLRHAERDGDKRTGASLALWSMAVAAVVAGPTSSAWLPAISRVLDAHGGLAGSQALPLLVGPALPVGFLGGVLAWMLSSKGPETSQRLSTAFGPLVRLSRRRFYLDEICQLVVARPLRLVSGMCRVAETAIVAPLTFGLSVRVPTWIARRAEALQSGAAPIYSLTAMLTVAVLLVLLLCLKG